LHQQLERLSEGMHGEKGFKRVSTYSPERGHQGSGGGVTEEGMSLAGLQSPRDDGLTGGREAAQDRVKPTSSEKQTI